jgi:hypothetical protein
MRTILFLFGLTCSLISCSKYTQIFQTTPATRGITSSDRVYFENDTVRITYSFWQKEGTLAYSIYNKLSTPIYIDWKKSSYIGNSVKMDYWVDETITKSVTMHTSTAHAGYGYYGLLGLSSGTSMGNSHSVKPERITFIAPRSNFVGSKFRLYPYTDEKLKKGAVVGSINNPATNKAVPITYKDFKEANSPLSFRNFLTISTSEKFENEYYIDNGFFVSRISQMKKSVFLGRTSYDHGTVYEMPFKGPALFYIDTK